MTLPIEIEITNRRLANKFDGHVWAGRHFLFVEMPIPGRSIWPTGRKKRLQLMEAEDRLRVHPLATGSVRLPGLAVTSTRTPTAPSTMTGTVTPTVTSTTTGTVTPKATSTRTPIADSTVTLTRIPTATARRTPRTSRIYGTERRALEVLKRFGLYVDPVEAIG